MTFDEWMSGVAPAVQTSDDSVAAFFASAGSRRRPQARSVRQHLRDGIGAGYAGAARRLGGQHATHAAGQRDGANKCAAAIRMTPNAALSGPNRHQPACAKQQRTRR